ncbi:DUF6624 domain-containing protein [Streptomyces sp. NPDC091268]|uniref:DUF6624 domain-containing protein n=1 Tax=Streptomyces sp. NPDC091268 TaxID=3365979 RepID=UPI00381A0D6B
MAGSTGDLAQVDADNTAWLKGVIAEHGWPGFSLVGERGAHDVWLIAQHAGQDPKFQEHALTLLTAAAERGDADPGHMAYPTDRTLMAGDHPQMYGTQYTGHGADLRTLPVADLTMLDARRAAVGLDIPEEYVRPADALPTRRRDR